VTLTEAPGWKDQGIENLAKSPHAKLRDIPVRAVTITSGFWAQRREINVTRSIPTMRDLLEANGRVNNFLRLTGKSKAAQSGPVYSDSDIYKWTEAVGFVLQSGDRPELRASADNIIDEVVAVQESNGYLNTYYQDDRKSLRMLPQTQTTGHELYNIGHMLQGAIAFYRATGDRRLLDAGIRFVNDFLIPSYGPAPKKPIVSGHPEIEMGLIELYRITGDKGQLDLAGYILGGDKRIELPERRTIYMFSGTPFTSRTKMEGHAVRAMYACCGATDYYLETGDATYLQTLNTLWNGMKRSSPMLSSGHCTTESIPECRWMARCTVIEIPWPSIPRPETRFAIPGTTRPAALRISNVPSDRCRDISTAPARMEFTCISTTIPNSTGGWKTESVLKSRRKRIIHGMATLKSRSRRRKLPTSPFICAFLGGPTTPK
jgi:hypothetical protein